VLCCIPDTEREERMQQHVGSVDVTRISDDRRIKGMIRWTLEQAIEGNRNNSLMRLHRMVRDLTGSKEEADRITYETNSMLENPLPEIELQKTVCRLTHSLKSKL
jgi:hypothetical protein